MTKATIARAWIGGLIAFGAGTVVALFGVFLMLVFGGTFSQVGGTHNYNFTPDMNSAFWAGVSVIVTGGLVILGGLIVQFAAWLGALVNSYALPEKLWFVVLLLGGLLSFGVPLLGFAAMLAYVIAAPDGGAYRGSAPPSQPAALAPAG